MNNDESHVCTVIAGVGYDDREVLLVWIDSARLGILVQSQEKPFLLSLDVEMTGIVTGKIPEFIAGIMGLFAICTPAEKVMYGYCIHVAHAMMTHEHSDERMLALLERVPAEVATVAMSHGWTQARALVEEVLSPDDREKISQACLLHFTAIPENSKQ